LRLCIDLKVGKGIGHGVHMARLPRQIKKVLMTPHEVFHAVLVANIGNVDAEAILDPVDVKRFPPYSE